ncbi:uncharacterized protein G2W53_027315 [Senna tora]|uniref:Uncharacterized protein n=1 Tax=Senna tora TaxID=362788 RepID=A0A834TJ49_9FABA|nr:uncharacterized protein G2W53_027315 [Senna tora]
MSWLLSAALSHAWPPGRLLILSVLLRGTRVVPEEVKGSCSVGEDTDESPVGEDSVGGVSSEISTGKEDSRKNRSSGSSKSPVCNIEESILTTGIGVSLSISFLLSL